MEGGKALHSVTPYFAYFGIEYGPHKVIGSINSPHDGLPLQLHVVRELFASVENLKSEHKVPQRPLQP